MSIRNLYLVLPLGAALSVAACSAESGNDSTTNPTVTPGVTGGAAGGAAPGGATTPPAGGTTTPATPGGTTPVVTPGGAAPGGTSVVTPGAAGGASPTGGLGALPGGAATGGTASTGGTGATAGTGGTGGGTGGLGVGLESCDAGAATGAGTKKCGEFISTTKVKLQLGPYGGTMEPNVGQGFETADEGLGPLICDGFASSFGEDPEATKRLLDVSALKMTLYTVYRPVNWPATPVPIVTWGNGTCAQPEGYGALLRYIASHGFLVVAPNNRFVGDGLAQKKALDFAFAANMNAMSPYYQKLDTTKVIAMGHSQGGLGTTAASSDARIKAAILFNGGTSAPKPFLALSGDRDLDFGDMGSPAAMGAAVTRSTQPQVAWLWYHKIPGTGASAGHLTLMTQPERLAAATVAWSKHILQMDPESKTYFAGASCKLCNMKEDFEFGQKGIQ